MLKGVTDNISKGDIVGIDNEGLLTNIFSDAVSFVVKSTNPSYVGGDAWGNIVGKRPERTEEQTEEEFAPILEAFEKSVALVPDVLECHLMAGTADYMLKVVAGDTDDFARIHRQYLVRLPHVSKMQSSFALRTVFKTNAMPV